MCSQRNVIGSLFEKIVKTMTGICRMFAENYKEKSKVANVDKSYTIVGHPSCWTREEWLEVVGTFRQILQATNSIWCSSSLKDQDATFKMSIFNLKALKWMPRDLTYDKSTLAQVMAPRPQATSSYLSECLHMVTRPQRVNGRCIQGVYSLSRLSTLDILKTREVVYIVLIGL